MYIQLSMVMCYYIGSNLMPVMWNVNHSNILLVLICVVLNCLYSVGSLCQ